MVWRRLWIAYTTIVYRETLKFLRSWPQSILPPVVTTSLYFVIFGNLIGARIGDMDGHRYIDFIVPGLILMAVITSTYAHVSLSFFLDKFERSIEELQISPTPNAIVLLGYVSGGMICGILVGLIIAIVALFFSRFEIHNYWIMASVTILTALLFSLSGFLNGIFAKRFDDVLLIPIFILTPLTYLGGIFYSIKLLPNFWQAVSHVNPILYMINAFRHGFAGGSDINIKVSYAIILLFVAVLFFINLKLLNRGVGLRE